MSILSRSIVTIAEPNEAVAAGLRAIFERWGAVCQMVRSSTELDLSLKGVLPDLLVVNIDLVAGVEGLHRLACSYPMRLIGMTAHFLPAGSEICAEVPCLEMPFTIPDLQRAMTSASPCSLSFQAGPLTGGSADRRWRNGLPQAPAPGRPRPAGDSHGAVILR
ncbi:hypothetical protein [Azospirillum melinis]